VKIAWPRGDLEVICASEKLLRQRFAEADAAVKLLLTVLHQSDTLREVRNFRSIQLFLVHPTGKRDGGLLIRHKEIDVTATLLNDDNATLYETASDSCDWLNPIRRLRILTISDNG
tara:strand:+ start:1434 stop:1781 length:348 start_codon:yes stop_codon:yes gene_type:complete